MKKSKCARLLDIYIDLERGKCLCKAELANRYGVDERTIQRDIDHLRCYYAESFLTLGTREIVYDRANNCYKLAAA